MSTQMADPHEGMLSFQQALRADILELAPVKGHPNVFSHFDMPAPGVGRLTYVLLDNNENLQAFVSCVRNGTVDGHICVSLGYAVPEALRNQGLATRLSKVVVEDTVLQVGRAGHKAVYIEAIVDAENVPSQKVAEAVLKTDRESITDRASARPAFRYTQRYETKA